MREKSLDKNFVLPGVDTDPGDDLTDPSIFREVAGAMPLPAWLGDQIGANMADPHAYGTRRVLPEV